MTPDMKKIFYIMALAAATLFGCTPASNSAIEFSSYEGNKTVVILSSEKAIPAEGGSVIATVSTPVDFDVRLPEKDTWLTFSRADSVLTFTAVENTASTLRYSSAAIVDSERDIILTRIEIQQEGTEKEIVKKAFGVSPTILSVDADATTASFGVTGEVSWTVTSDNSSFVPSPASGNGNGTVTVSFPANTDTENAVTANLTVSTEDDAYVTSYTVTITQAKAKAAGLDPVKPAAGTVLAEWYFATSQLEVLSTHFNEAVTNELADAPGNGGLYVEPNVSGKGRLEYYNGIDKAAAGIVDSAHKRCKRSIGNYGEPVVYGTYKDDYILWTAYTENEAPLAAGTKLALNFVLRPNNVLIMKYWLLEDLDGDEWKVAGETKDGDGFKYNVELFYTDGGGNQTNTFINHTVTLTKDTDAAVFRITAVSNTGCDGNAVSIINKSHALRFAGEDCNASTPEYSVKEHPMIKVVE